MVSAVTSNWKVSGDSGVLIVDADLRVVGADAGACRITGVQGDDIQGHSIASLLGLPGDVAVALTEAVLFDEAFEPRELLLRVPRSPVLRSVRIRAATLRLTGGDHDGLFVTLEDLTPRQSWVAPRGAAAST